MILFIICLIASTVGAVAGFGGGVIIKPVMDALGLLPVSTISFLSGCTVFSMSVSSLIKNRNDGVKLDIKKSTPLAMGAILGGIIGKAMFQYVRNHFENENVLGFVQAIFLVGITIGVFIYVLKKNSMKSYHIDSTLLCIVIGTVLGIISSFLGIGGGTSNVAMLFFFFSMNAKEAAKNSIYIIMFSQIASIIIAVVNNTVPHFELVQLIAMASGGVGGALIGAIISKKLNNELIEKLLRVMLAIVICINFYNVVKFGTHIF
mgnify:FL=1